MKRTKKIIFKRISVGILAVSVFSIALLFSCKDNELGTPVILSVHLLDTIKKHRDSTFVGIEPGRLIVIHGQNIGDVKKAYFNEYQATFNTAYNTNTDLIITIPSLTTTDSTADNLIRLVTSHGEATYSFKVIAKPAIYSYDRVNYGTDNGYDITFKGKNFSDMIKVVAYKERDSTEVITDSVICQIMSKSTEVMVVRVPSNTLSRVIFHFTNSSGTTIGTNSFVNMDLAMKFFTDSYGTFTKSGGGTGQWAGDSWNYPETVNSDQVYAGTKSFSILLNLDATGWKWFGFNSGGTFVYDPAYKYITFAIKGGDFNTDLWLSSNATKGGGVGGFPDVNKITTVAKVWTYYKLKISGLDLLYKNSTITQIGFRPKGPNDPAFLYVDDVMLIK